MSNQTRVYMSIRQAAFIGVGAMVGAGIFSLLGAAGEVAGAAVWLSFVMAGCIAGLQGYSFAKLGAKYPSGGGLLEYVAQGFGPGHVTRVTAWLTYGVNAVITAMVASSFGSYASAVVRRRQRDVDEDLCRPDHPRDDGPQHRGVAARGAGADRDRRRCDREPGGIRGGDAAEHQPAVAGAFRVSSACGTSSRAWRSRSLPSSDSAL